jgi:hypothetical protein
MNQLNDRYHLLLNQDKLTGIDFIHVDPDQVNLKIYFFQSEKVMPEILLASIDKSKISIRSSSKTKLPVIPVADTGWMVIGGRNVLKITTFFSGDFTSYRLSIDSPNIDPCFNDVKFSFKVNCPGDMDCKTKEIEYVPEKELDFPIDYLARDFWSFRRALLDFASLRFPDWKERLEADTGIMLAEVISAMGDEFAYYQDRVGREAYLESATQRRSVRHHARLVDYFIDDGQTASTWLDYRVSQGFNEIPAGLRTWALSDRGDQIFYETGTGLDDHLSDKKYEVSGDLNVIQPYIHDENNLYLPVGCTEMYLDGHHQQTLEGSSALPLNEKNGKWILLQTNPENTSFSPRRHVVRLIKAENQIDPLNGASITHIAWESSQAIPSEICLKSDFHMEIHGNIIPAIAGNLQNRYFIIGPDPDSLQPLTSSEGTTARAIEREGRDGSVIYLFSLPGSKEEPLAWSLNEGKKLIPQICLTEVTISGDFTVEKIKNIWKCRKSLQIPYPSGSDDLHYTLDDGFWEPVVKYQRNGAWIVHRDYVSGDGTTIRFGDGEFGRIPSPGTLFKVTYILGGGAKANVPADSITNFDHSLNFISAVTNPVPVTRGENPESLAHIRKMAPYMFRHSPKHAVLAHDYVKVATDLDWIQKAGVSFRWTGSWLSAIVTPDPKGSTEFNDKNKIELINYLNQYRQAGREMHVMNPDYADLKMVIKVCTEPYSLKDEVRQRIYTRLLGEKGVRSVTGFFSADNFTFGTKLDRSKLEAAIQSVQGVKAVVEIRFGRRGFFKDKLFSEPAYNPGKNSIIRIENDLLHPEKGTLTLEMEGGI